MGLTEKQVRDAKPSDQNRIEWDDQIKGLGLRVTKAGAKAFIVNLRVAGRERRITIGRPGEISLAEARRKASAIIQAGREGIDPVKAREAQKAALFVNEALDRFVDEHIPRRIALGRMRERTAREYSRQIDKHLRPSIGKQRVPDVEKRDIERMLSGLAPVLANRVLALVSTFFTRCEGWGIRAQNTNPARGIEKAVEEPRDRTLSADEMSRLGRALDETEGDSPAALAIRLAALTGLRISEVLGIHWRDIDLERGLLTLEATKTGRRTHSLPEAARHLLSVSRRNGPCVIPGRKPDKPLDYSALRRRFTAVAKTAGLEGVTLHDLRRTLMTDAAASGANAHLLRDMLGHRTTAMADRYIRAVSEPLVELREQMGAKVASSLLAKRSDGDD